jgi:hypothetical protein
MNAGNTVQQWRMSDEHDKWESAPACTYVQQARHVELHDLGPIQRRCQVKCVCQDEKVILK